MENKKTKIMIEAALMVALSVVLNYIKFAPWPNGGSITLAAMTPIVVLSLRRGWKWGLLGGFAFSLLQMLLDGVSAPPVTTFNWYFAVFMLDYVLAYSVLGAADIFAKMIKNKTAGYAFGAFAVTTVRYICHIISGVIIWGVYAPEGVSPMVYSLLYNGSYMIPEIIITAVVACFVTRIPQIKMVDEG